MVTFRARQHGRLLCTVSLAFLRLLVRSSHNPLVVGSSPTRPTINQKLITAATTDLPIGGSAAEAYRRVVRSDDEDPCVVFTGELIPAFNCMCE